MGSSTVRVAFRIAIFLTTLAISDCQISILATGIPKIVSLLEDVNGTSADMSAVLPQLASVLKNQKDVQILTNLLLQNNTAIIGEFIREKLEYQNELLTSQQENQNQNAHLLQKQQNSLDQMVSSPQENQNQTVSLLQKQQSSLDQMVSSLKDIANSNIKMAAAQTQLANSFNQVVSLLQKQDQQHHNLTVSMSSAVSILQTQQEILEDINRSLPLVFDQQEKQIDLLNLTLSAYDRPCGQQLHNSTAMFIADGSILGNQAVDLLQIQSLQLQNFSSGVTSQLHAQTQLLFLQNTGLDCYYIYKNVDDQSSFNKDDFWDELFTLNCNMDIDENGWIVFQHRFDGSVNFFQEWDAYETGFGRPNGEFWAGLRQIHQMTQTGAWQLRIDMEAFDGDTAYAMYDSFSVGDASSKYQLHIGDYCGTAGDSLTLHNGMAFSTKDRDNDAGNRDCAQLFKGGWWYEDCHHSNLNALYLGATGNRETANRWWDWKRNQSLKRTEMKMRRVQ